MCWLKAKTRQGRALYQQGTGSYYFSNLKIENHGEKTFSPRVKQLNMRLGENDLSKKYWKAAGIRGSALGQVGAPQIDHFVEEAAADCGSDPGCVCDWAGKPRQCLYEYCCGTLVGRLGQSRPDYQTVLPSVEDRVEGKYQEMHLEKWQRICQPEQTFFSKHCSKQALPANDNRRH
ncbi:hypothetical protein GUITHDRAFT_115894 [Guillardia theta CCMP2712]|uniref:Uncharacterized protein n=1 Tax=Guillardia theta (strain CCMP2712) TaxID=905079 RepID=L1INT4_GUITC|nr:hypothetical protein GUITHDRAFT_115894 [Guillardia theta CCMP2712]EKX37918.1 hypothetical protein GUITHDRAFT_115894 [Guillardia theta CCMP2712]|eukprot:XP_005824898.1 hypothetical protein GUITHDRAFT_115894 [Guillardia theta CCMP2712]